MYVHANKVIMYFFVYNHQLIRNDFTPLIEKIRAGHCYGPIAKALPNLFRTSKFFNEGMDPAKMST